MTEYRISIELQSVIQKRVDNFCKKRYQTIPVDTLQLHLREIYFQPAIIFR